MPSTTLLCVVMVLAAVAACAWAATNDTLFDELDYGAVEVHFEWPDFPRRERFLRGWHTLLSDLSFNWTHELPEWGQLIRINHQPIREALFYNGSGAPVFPDRARFLRVNASAPTMRALVSTRS